MKRNFDQIDKRILVELQEHGRIPIVELANRINLTKTPCAERVRRLERDGVIRGYRAELDPEPLGAGFVMIVLVTLNQTSDNSLEMFNDAVRRIPEIQTCFMVAGNFDYMLVARTTDISHYRNVLGDRIGKLPGVQQTHSYVVMEEITNRKAIPI